MIQDYMFTELNGCIPSLLNDFLFSSLLRWAVDIRAVRHDPVLVVSLLNLITFLEGKRLGKGSKRGYSRNYVFTVHQLNAVLSLIIVL